MIVSIGKLHLHFFVIKGREMLDQKLLQNIYINKITSINDNHSATRILYLLY